MACKTDPALAITDALAAALTDSFTGTQCPPLVGNVEAVRFFAGDGAPLAAWDSHTSNAGCDAPFVWVRATSRYRSREFPAPTIDMNPCGDTTRVLAVEIGVGWCAVIDQEPTWDQYAEEAATAMDAAWRMEMALCRASADLRLNDEGRLVGTDTLVPYGPEGGVIAWTGTLYASY